MKRCYFCAHMEFKHTDGVVGCETCGYGAEDAGDTLVCTKGCWPDEVNNMTDLRVLVKLAETCPHYTIMEDTK